MEEQQKPAIAAEVRSRLIEGEMKQSYLTYSMSVIVGRALPDVRDGLKPVHRRVLYTMYETGLLHNKSFKKSANVVGNCMARYHPHGDAAIYDTLVRLAQDFSLRYPLVNGQGNFGSVDGDAAAAMRYTECKLKKIAEELLQDIDKETVPFVDNFDGSMKEPFVLPAKLPNLLINGSSGIAVGMATNIPPHNIKEVCSGVIALINNPDIEISELISHIPAPDFPTGGIICGTSGIQHAYAKGRGKLKIRSKTHLEEIRKDKQAIIVTEIPYQVNKAVLLEEIAHKVRDKVITGISDLRDESDREGMRVVIELKQGANDQVVLNQLFSHSRLQISFGMNMLALDNNEPKTLNLKEFLEKYLAHRVDIVTKRSEYDLRKAKERAHILEGLIIALDNIDSVIALIKKAQSTQVAQEQLINEYDLSEAQAKSILEMRLQRLTSMEQDKIRDEQKQLLVKISDLEEILASHERKLNIIKEELNDLMVRYGDDRRSEISHDELDDFEIEELIKPEDMVVTLSHVGYVKRIPVDTYREQRRGGRGITAAGTKDDDFLEHVFVANTHDYMLFFTNFGKVKWLKVHQLPQASRTARGSALVNLLQLQPDEHVTAFERVKEFNDDHFIFFATEQGVVKRTPLKDFSRPRKGGIIALGLRDGDRLINAAVTDGKSHILLATRNGLAIKFDENNVRPMGRTATGVRGINLKDNDKVIGMIVIRPGVDILTLCTKGYGKRTPESDYRSINRGGVGVINIKCTEKNGKVVSVKPVTDDDSLMIVSKNGIIIRTSVKNISSIGRNTQGVRIMRVSDDEVASAALIPPGEDDGSDEDNSAGLNDETS